MSAALETEAFLGLGISDGRWGGKEFASGVRALHRSPLPTAELFAHFLLV